MVCIISVNISLFALICTVSILLDTAACVFFSVDSYGAKGDGVVDDIEAFLAAWNAACTSSSDSIFHVPQRKKYLVKAIHFKGPCKASDLTVVIAGTVAAPDDPATWNPQDSRVWLQFSYLQGLTIQGGGTIEGSGQKWWANSCKIDRSKICQPAPTAMTVYSSANVILRNLTFRNSQQIHIEISCSTNVQVEALQIVAPEDSPNTDGIHVANSQHVVIQNSTIRTGDDCVSIVTGSSDIQINNLVCGPGHGISIGSLGKNNAADNVSNVVVDGVFLNGSTNGLRVKTWQGGSGSAQGFIFRNVKMNDVSNPIIIDQYYCDSSTPCQNQTSAVQVNNVTYRDISGTSATREAIRLACSDTVPCQTIVMENINLYMSNGDAATSFCESVHGFNNGQVIPQTPCLQAVS